MSRQKVAKVQGGPHVTRLALLALAAALIPASADALDPAQVIMPTDPGARAAQEEYGYAEAVIAGDMVYLSGVVVGLRPGETDLVPAYARAFERIGGSLARAGSGLDQIVDITSFHTDIEPQVAAMAKAKKAVIPGPHPAWTAIGVTRLLPPTGLTEIKVVARLKGRRG
jgi:enamine deaminase RidA (YjgF/YER057c/UK114 family)